MSEFGIRFRRSEQRLGPGDVIRLLLRKPIVIDVEQQYIVELRLGWRSLPIPTLDLDQEFFSGRSAFELTDRDTYLTGVSVVASELGVPAGHVRGVATWLCIPLASPHPETEGPFGDGAILRQDEDRVRASLIEKKKR